MTTSHRAATSGRAQYIRIELLQERVSEAKIALAKMFTERQIEWNNRVIDAYLERTTQSFNEERYARL